MKSAACDISANWKIAASSDRIALGRRDGGAARGLAGTIDPCGDACGRIECGKHTRSIFFDMRRPFRPLVSLQRSLIAVNYAGRKLCGAVTRSRARSHDRAGQRTRATDAAAHLRGRAGPADGSHQTRAELAASASGAAHGSPASCRIACYALGLLRLSPPIRSGGQVDIDRRPDAVGGPVIEQPPADARAVPPHRSSGPAPA